MGMRLRGIGVLAGLVAVVPALRAQDFGVTGGVVLSKFGGEDAAEAGFDKTRFGLAGGAFAYFRLSDHFGLQPEALYVQKGGKGEEGGITTSARLSYIEVPFLLKAGISSGGGRIRPHLLGGGAVAFKVGCSLKVTGGGASISDDCEGDDVEGTDFSLVFGAGVDIDRFTISARYTLGLSKVDASPDESDIKNRAFYLLVAWAFRPPR